MTVLCIYRCTKHNKFGQINIPHLWARVFIVSHFRLVLIENCDWNGDFSFQVRYIIQHIVLITNLMIGSKQFPNEISFVWTIVRLVSFPTESKYNVFNEIKCFVVVCQHLKMYIWTLTQNRYMWRPYKSNCNGFQRKRKLLCCKNEIALSRQMNGFGFLEKFIAIYSMSHFQVMINGFGFGSRVPKFSECLLIQLASVFKCLARMIKNILIKRYVSHIVDLEWEWKAAKKDVYSIKWSIFGESLHRYTWKNARNIFDKEKRNR